MKTNQMANLKATEFFSKASSFLSVIGLLLSMTVPLEAQAANEMIINSTKGKFDDVKSSVVFAIENRGMTINTVSHVGEMLDRTGKDMGAAKQVFLHAQVLEFCSAKISRQVMEADPHTIVFCPYGIAVYELPTEPGKIYVSYRKPTLTGKGAKAGKAALRSVEKLLHEIVREALQ